MYTPDKELRRMVDGWYDGSLPPTDRARLQQRILVDAEAKEYFLQMAELEGAFPAAISAVVAQPARRMPWRRWLQMAAMFTLGAGVVGWGWFSNASRSHRKESHITHAGNRAQARITGMIGVTWPQTGAHHLVEFHADSDTAAIESGLLELTFATGTRAVIEGPARFRVSGDNAMLLDHGKVVAEVPRGAEGFRIAYAAGEVVDLGTEFALEVPKATGMAHLGVFRGEVEYHPKDGDRIVKLTENHAVDTTGREVVSVPFDQSRFTRDLPSREFAWEVKDASGEQKTWEFDISHLVWRPGHYRAICKWMTGFDGVELDGAELRCNGQLIANDNHKGFSGHLYRTSANIFELEVPAKAYKRGRWTLQMKVRIPSAHTPVGSHGVVLIEDGLAIQASPNDFIGTWEYLHDGTVYRRIFHADGTTSLTLDGRPDNPIYQGGRWKVVDGCLEMQSGPNSIERHLLRDRETLIFINQPYRDARRVNP